MSPKYLRKNQDRISEPYAKRHLDAIAGRWDEKAQEWERNLMAPDCHLNEDDAYIRFTEQLDHILYVKKKFCIGKGVIDAGCATGLILARAISSFSWGIGVDISPRMIDLAKAKPIPLAKFLVGDCFDLSRICPKAGAVLSRGVLLSHYGRKQGVELLQSARTCLEKGGFVLWDFLSAAARQSFQHAPQGKAYFDPQEVCDMALEADFRLVKVLGGSERRVLLLLAEC